MRREQWTSRLGFIWAAVGSAVGLGNIWRFPYVVGANGGAAFILLYFLCLILVGFPVLIAETLTGRTAQKSPAGAFKELGKTKTWKGLGLLTILTGFLVTTFYGVISGMTLGYLFEALRGNLSDFTNPGQALAFYNSASHSSTWMLVSFALFTILSLLILTTGVKKGIEAGNKIMMPLLFVVLILLVIKGLTLENAANGLKFLFNPDWSLLTPTAVIMALGQAFFALSLGQGTMVTYGSYVSKSESLPGTCVPITLFGTAVSLLSGIAIFAIVFSVGLEPGSGPSLMFQTLPVVFSTMTGGYILALAFLLLLVLAGITSQISALEPLISYLIDEKKWKRKKAVIVSGLCSFAIGIPSALSFGILGGVKLFGLNIFDLISFVCVNILIPVGGLLAVILIGWRFGIKKGISHLEEGSKAIFNRFKVFKWYLRIGIKYVAPLLILLILMDLLGFFKLFK